MIMNCLDKYLDMPYSLDLNQMHSLHIELLSEIGNDSDAMELYDDLIAASTKYAAIRASWLSMTNEEKMSTDSIRTSYHDSVIIHFNMIARYLRTQGKKAVWRDILGDDKTNRYFRKSIGDFSCYIVFINSLCAR